MQLFYKFVLASIIFASSVVANPAVADTDKQAEAKCTNPGRLDHDEGDCRVGQSLGIMSRTECQKVLGGTYYCVTGGNKLCFSMSGLDDLTSSEVFDGECFA